MDKLNAYGIDVGGTSDVNNLWRVNTVEKKWLIALEPERTCLNIRHATFYQASLKQNIYLIPSVLNL